MSEAVAVAGLVIGLAATVWRMFAHYDQKNDARFKDIDAKNERRINELRAENREAHAGITKRIDDLYSLLVKRP